MAYLPAAQAVHAVVPVTDATALYLPTAHAEHAMAPVVTEYVPGGHAVQLCAARSAMIEPAGHAPLQFAAVAPCSEYLPAAQAVHTVACVAAVTLL